MFEIVKLRRFGGLSTYIPLPKKLSKKIGWKPGDYVKIEVVENKLILTKIE